MLRWRTPHTMGGSTAISSVQSLHSAQKERSLAVAQIALAVGTTRVSLKGFTKSHGRIAGKILVPLKAGVNLPHDSAQRKHMFQISRSILSYRQTAEWGMRELQGSFGRLRIPLGIEDMEYRADLIDSCFRLHNLRTRLVGINQIKNVYVPVWHEGDGKRIWEGFENILFSDQRKHDRVKTFHVQEEWY